MDDLRDRLEREGERFRMPDGSLEALRRRRERRRRGRQVASGALALVIAGLGTWGAVVAFGGRTRMQPVDTPTPSVSSPTEVPTTGPSPTGSPTTVPPTVAAASQPSGTIQFVDELRGWAVSGGDILATTDRGATWSRLYEGPLEVTAVQFVDAEHGWAVSDVLLRTTDGGVTWVDTGFSGLSSVQFVTQELGWGVLPHEEGVAGVDYRVRTTDGGVNWHAVDAPHSVDSLCFVSEVGGTSTLWVAVAGEGGVTLSRSSDDGASWDDFSTALPEGPWTATVRCGGNDAWVLVEGGGAAGHQAFGLSRTDEGGLVPVLQEAGTHPFGTDQGVPYAEGSYPGPFVAFDWERAYFIAWCPPCGNTANVHLTSDGGATWTMVEIVGVAQPFVPIGMSFISPDEGWVLLERTSGDGTDFLVLRTMDGGATWSELG